MAGEILLALLRANAVAALAVIAVLLLRNLVRRWFGARSAYALWLLPPLATLASLLPARHVTAAATVTAPPELAAITATEASPLEVRGLMAEPLSSASREALAQINVSVPADSALWLIVLWLGGALLSLAVLTWRQRRYENALGELMRSESDGVRVFRAAASTGPFLIGAFKPRIVVPVDFEQRFQPDERALVLAHERAHLEAGDAQINALIEACVSLCWFNPLVHIAANVARRDQELACDAAVLARFPHHRRLYAETLLKTQLHTAAPLVCAWPAHGPHPLRERVAFLSQTQPRWALRSAGALAVLALTSAAAAAAWATQPPVIDAAPIPHNALANVVTAAQPSAAAGVATFANMPIELTGIAAHLEVLPEDRDTIAFAASPGAALHAPTARIEGDRLVIDGGLGEAGNRCRQRFDGVADIIVPDRGAIAARDLPTVILRTPRHLDLLVRGVVASRIGASAGGRIRIDGCGDAQIAEAAGALEVRLNGLGHVNVRSVRGALDAQLYGVGDLTAGPVRGGVSALMQGSGAMTIGDVGAGAVVRTPGSGAIQFGAITGPLDVSGGGSSIMRVASLRGRRLNVSFTGSSMLGIGGGETQRMEIDLLRGSSAVHFNGHAGEARVRLGDGAGDVRIGSAGRIETERSRYANARVITG